MKRALVSLENIGPGAPYDTAENLQKLRAIADFLQSANVPFGINLIPRFVNPPAGYDKAVNQTADPFIQTFNDTINYMVAKGGAIHVEGYTHQFGNSVSGGGFEFASLSCVTNCPPNDSLAACAERIPFEDSYAFGRMDLAFDTVAEAGFQPVAFDTPGSIASSSQRCVVEAWAGLIDDDDPLSASKKTLTIRDTDSPFYRGVVYVPVPLGYVSSDDPQADVDRICQAVLTYGENDLASFLYHPFLEFPFITISGPDVIYAENSYLKQLVQCIKDEGFTFIPITGTVNFGPSSRQTSFLAGTQNRVYAGDVDGDGKDELIVWDQQTGTWYIAVVALPPFPARQNASVSPFIALTNWAQGTFWKPLIGDFDGDGQEDVAVYNPVTGSWQVALSDGAQFIPHSGQGDFQWLASWALGSYWVPFVGDFDGDGKDDVMVWNPSEGTWQVALSTGSRFVPSPGAEGNFIWLQSWAVGTFWVPVIGDFDGDGKDDIAVLNPNNGTWQVALSTGSQFVPNPGLGNFLWLSNFGQGGFWTPLAGDFNGDGKDDVLIVASGNWQVALSSGSSFTADSDVFFPWAAQSGMQPLTGDFNGDGKTDICARHPTLRDGTVDFAISLIAT